MNINTRFLFFKKIADSEELFPQLKDKCYWCGSDNFINEINDKKYCAKCESHVCNDCGQKVEYDLILSDGLNVCKDCAGYTKCKYCEERVPKDEIEKSEDGLCKECSSYTKCPNCEETVLKDDIKVTKNRHGHETKDIGCDECVADCNGGRCRIADFKTNMQSVDGDYYCDDCFGEYFSICEECHDTINAEDSFYVDDRTLCHSCFDSSYSYCSECSETYLQEDLRRDPDTYDLYCKDCAPELFGEGKLPKEYESLKKIEEVPFHKFDRILNQLKKLLPITPRELSKNHPRLAASCKDIIAFAEGKELTPELVARFEADMSKQSFPVSYSTWRSSLQRSVRSSTPQLVINIIASPQLLAEMQEDKTYLLFEKINQVSKSSGHPHAENQLGWARVELHPTEKYILVDEIQTDHMNAIDRIKTEQYQGKSYADYIKERLGLNDAQFAEYLNKYKNHIRDFSDLAIETIANFAKTNGYEKIFYHTYESGKKLKRNDPPKSLYTDVPVRHFFAPTEEKPFDLEGDFFVRQAEELLNLCNLFYKAATKV